MNHPHVVISPQTSSDQPYALKLGNKLLITIAVESLADLSPDYELLASHLSPECYTLGTPAISADQEHRQQIEVVVHPPQMMAIGKHQLHLHLQSADSEVIWEHLVYLQFLAADDIEIMLTPDRTVIQDGVGLYQLDITNTSEVEQELTLRPHCLQPRSGCLFQTEPAQITLAPDGTEKVELMVQPQHWWLRPWFGKGKNFRFQVDLQTPEGTLLPQSLAQGTLVWQPYPRSQSLRLLAVLLVALATSSALIWRFLFPPQSGPSIAGLQSTQMINPQTGQKDIHLNWTIKNSQKLSKLVLWRQGKGGSTIAKTYWFKGGIPQTLQRSQSNQTFNFCQYDDKQTKTLACNGIETGTADSGEYQFKLQAFSTQDANEPTDVETTASIAFTPNAIPQIVRFVPDGLEERTDPFTTNPALGPVALAPSPGPITLNWDIANPSQITELQLMTVDVNNAEASLLQRFRFQGRQLPQKLAKFCTFAQILTCRHIPTAARQPGSYFFKLNAVYQQDQKSFTLTKTIGPMTLQAEPLRIASFLINGQKAPTKYVLKAGQNTLDLSWNVVGGTQPIVAMLPQPGKLPTVGKMQLKLNPQQQGMLTLQATDSNGKRVLQTVAIARQNVASLPGTASPKPDPSQVQPPSPSNLPPPIFSAPAADIPQPKSPVVVSKPTPTKSPVASKPVPAKAPVVSVASPKSKPQYSQESLAEAQTITRGLVVARQKRKIVLNGDTWNKAQDMITLLRRGYNRQEAAQKAGVPLWKLNVLATLGERTK
ncbi:MAG: hypothetical protein HC851_04175 [Acaryochloris sp. RU_4_1]|nr:hypothetical protein [Acaryochloris sp. RU_4_1]NJR56908.1 hypothetical protein [Acaryochloris sp. CRU_2_0]